MASNDFMVINIQAYKNEELCHAYSYRYCSKFVPRIGEKICYQYWKMEIFDIAWDDEVVYIKVDCSHFA